ERTFLETSFNIPQTELTPNGWRLESPQVLRLIDEMQCATKPLTEYIKGRFYSGIKLGLNEAFIVDDATRKGMISSDPSSRQILKPFLRGKDVKRWCIKSANLYMCYVGWDTDIKLYPAIHAHLLKFKEPLMARPEVQEGRHPWYALSRYAADYWQEFEHPKIVFPDIAQSPQFAWDETGSFLGNTLYLMPTEEKWLLGLLNSKIIFWFYRHLSPQIRGGFVRYIAQYVSQIPVPPISQLQQAVITKLVNYILFIKREGLAEDESLSNSRDQLMIRYFEQLIDAIVYELFLTDELHQAGKHFFEPLMRENLPDLKEIKGDKLATLRSIFERLFDKDHIIRQNLFFLDTLESVRIIEGKA
ncbi:MAG TPA: TaqI-like C-terminal specificity domain-containing protein, partial [Nitrososphaera sp.]|nr:TaqI-like C-terminal specificity domain-containing protein [Nitrososphaera sp.]